ncbi:hypothetical protein CI238_01817, partial [Colletotrichum incanum]
LLLVFGFPFELQYHLELRITPYCASVTSLPVGASSAVLSWGRRARQLPAAGPNPRSPFTNGKMAERSKAPASGESLSCWCGNTREFESRSCHDTLLPASELVLKGGFLSAFARFARHGTVERGSRRHGQGMASRSAVRCAASRRFVACGRMRQKDPVQKWIASASDNYIMLDTSIRLACDPGASIAMSPHRNEAPTEHAR